MPHVFVDVDLMKEYNSKSKTFHKKDRSILCVLDKETFIKYFDLGGYMSLSIDLDKLNENFSNHKNFYTGRTMLRHIPKSRNEQGDIPKKLGDFVPLGNFQRYLQSIYFGLNKFLGSYGTMDATGGHYIMALNI
jgi:hypothetical protein